jgi:hypothetical protein
LLSGSSAIERVAAIIGEEEEKECDKPAAVGEEESK